MKSLFAAFCALLLAAAPAAAAERRFIVTDFDEIELAGPYRVTLVTGRAPSAVAAGSREALERVSIEVEGKVLRIKPRRSGWGGYPGENAGPLAIALTGHEFREGRLTGPGILSIDRARGPRLQLVVKGTGRIEIGEVAAERVALGIVGAGAIALGGQAEEIEAKIYGAGNLEAEGLTAQRAEIDAATAGAVTLAVTDEARVRSRGSGDVAILGDPACRVDIEGLGQIYCGS